MGKRRKGVRATRSGMFCSAVQRRCMDNVFALSVAGMYQSITKIIVITIPNQWIRKAPIQHLKHNPMRKLPAVHTHDA
jgi:hypothetical protein